MELVVTIARGGDEPRLDRYDLERVVVRTLQSLYHLLTPSTAGCAHLQVFHEA
jgi:hypothetical protein